MELAELEVFSVAANQTIVRPPGRAFPGVVIQGDSLSLLARAALRVLATLKEAGADEETLEAAGLLASGLSAADFSITKMFSRSMGSNSLSATR